MLKISVIIPTYNQEQWIEKAIISAATQTYTNLEVIVTDDCSSDRTSEKVLNLLEQYERVKYFKNELNIGRVKNYHKGLYELASGDYCITLDGDDFFTDVHFIERAVSEIEKHEDCNILFFQGDSTSMKSWKKHSIETHSEAKYETKIYRAKDYVLRFHEIGFSHLATLFNRQIALQNEFYTLDILSSDIDSIIRMCLNNPDLKVLKTKSKVGIWLKHENNASSSKSFKKLLPSLTIYFEYLNHSNANKIGLSKYWALRQSVRPLAALTLRKLGILR